MRAANEGLSLDLDWGTFGNTLIHLGQGGVYEFMRFATSARHSEFIHEFFQRCFPWQFLLLYSASKFSYTTPTRYLHDLRVYFVYSLVLLNPKMIFAKC